MTELGTSRNTSIPPLDINPLESYVPLSSKPKITSTFDSDIDTNEIEVLETLFPEVIKLDLLIQTLFFLRLLNMRSLNHLHLLLQVLPLLFLYLSQNLYILDSMVNLFHTDLWVLKRYHKKNIILLLLLIGKDTIFIILILFHLFRI